MQCCAYRRQDGHLECRVPGWLRGALLRLGQHLASFPGERSGVWEFPGKCGTRGGASMAVPGDSAGCVPDVCTLHGRRVLQGLLDCTLKAAETETDLVPHLKQIKLCVSVLGPLKQRSVDWEA